MCRASSFFFSPPFQFMNLPYFFFSFTHRWCFQYFFFFFFFFWWGRVGALVAYGSTQARGWIGTIAASLRHSHSNVGSKLHLQPTPLAQGNTRFPTHRARLGMEPASSWIPVGFIFAAPQWELLFPVLQAMLQWMTLYTDYFIYIR